jgi:hypothetical protein
MDVPAFKSSRPVTRSTTTKLRLKARLQARVRTHAEAREAHRVRRQRRRRFAHDQEGWGAWITVDNRNTSDDFDSESRRDNYGHPPGIGLTSDGDKIEEMSVERQHLYWEDEDNFHSRFRRWEAGERVSSSVSERSETG